MPKSRPPYPAAFRQQMIELVQAGKTPAELSREFSCTSQTIVIWVEQAARDAGKPLPVKDGLSSAEREELPHLRRENRRLQTLLTSQWYRLMGARQRSGAPRR